jgi:hypothetical protein
MGCYNLTCAVSKLPITTQDLIKVFVLTSDPNTWLRQFNSGIDYEATSLDKLLHMPFTASYDDYGGITKIVEDEYSKRAEEVLLPRFLPYEGFEKTLATIVNTILRNDDEYKTVSKEYTQEKLNAFLDKSGHYQMIRKHYGRFLPELKAYPEFENKLEELKEVGFPYTVVLVRKDIYDLISENYLKNECTMYKEVEGKGKVIKVSFRAWMEDKFDRLKETCRHKIGVCKGLAKEGVDVTSDKFRKLIELTELDGRVVTVFRDFWYEVPQEYDYFKKEIDLLNTFILQENFEEIEKIINGMIDMSISTVAFIYSLGAMRMKLNEQGSGLGSQSDNYPMYLSYYKGVVGILEEKIKFIKEEYGDED